MCESFQLLTPFGPTDDHFTGVGGAARWGCAGLPAHRRVCLGLLGANALGADSRCQQAACQEGLAEHVFGVLKGLTSMVQESAVRPKRQTAGGQLYIEYGPHMASNAFMALESSSCFPKWKYGDNGVNINEGTIASQQFERTEGPIPGQSLWSPWCPGAEVVSSPRLGAFREHVNGHHIWQSAVIENTHGSDVNQCSQDRGERQRDCI